MYVLTPDRKSVSTEQELSVVFEEHREHGYAQLVLVSDEGDFLSALGEGFGPYTLEWFPAEPTGTHLRVTEELKSQEVLETLLAFLRGGTAWRESHSWQETEDEQAPWLSRFLGQLFGPKD